MPLEANNESISLSKSKISDNNDKKEKERYNSSNKIQNKRDDISLLDEDKKNKFNNFFILNEDNPLYISLLKKSHLKNIHKENNKKLPLSNKEEIYNL